jgi:hypothetical protein
LLQGVDWIATQGRPEIRQAVAIDITPKSADLPFERYGLHFLPPGFQHRVLKEYDLVDTNLSPSLNDEVATG